MVDASKLKYAVNINNFTKWNDFPGTLEFIKTADANGYDKVRFVDHIIGVDVVKHPHMAETPYTRDSNLNEVFTFMAYLSAIVPRIKFVTGVLGLPQRQTAIVAKQAAQVDNLSGGRLILGAGLGYNPVEFEALGSHFKTRARRFEEQIDVLRMLWTQDIVDFHGDFHVLDHVNIRPLPVQKPIPIWIGAGGNLTPIPPDAALDRIGRKADGWCPLFVIPEGEETLDQAAQECIRKVNASAAAAGRDPKTIDLELFLLPDGKSREQVLAEIDALHSLGANHIHVRFGADSPRGQIDSLKRFMDTIS